MKEIILALIFNYSFLIVNCYSQQYGWVDLSANIPDSNVSLRDVYAMGQEVWTAQRNGTNPSAIIFYSSDGGQTFVRQTVSANSGTGMSIVMRSPQEGYVVTNYGHVLRTTDGGNNWITIGTGMGLLFSVSFPPLPEPYGYACSGNGSVYKISGATVAQDDHVTGGTLYSIVFPINSDEGWVCGGTVIRHRDSTGWHPDQNYDTGNWYNAIYFVDNMNGWSVEAPSVGSSQNVVWFTHDGHNWGGHYISANSNLNDIFFINTLEGWAVGNLGLILHTTDAGVNWIREAETFTDSSTILLSVFAVNNQEVYVTGKKWYNNQDHPRLFKYTTITGIDEVENIPSTFKLEQNYPNPFNPSTIISYTLPNSGNVTLKIYDAIGKEVATLVDEYKPAGSYEVEFNASSSIRNLVSGIYFYQLKIGTFIQTKKMVLLR